ncbi:DUF1833 family protein [Rhizobacter sp. Root1221]|uniref:DUF1833 family protein n=1 Tax=Rhizobacter sp. Root1221 TaxID=1736433 RepID=UPI00138F2A98|nr:DUF1833 family protein [Rhizobacter sp. Root1221]
MLLTYELWHPTLPEPARIVHDMAPLEAMLESTAPRDAGEVVTFMASYVEASRSEESDDAATPTVNVTIDNVSGLLSDALRIARGTNIPWELIERVYASDDLSGPAMLPVLRLTFTESTIDGTSATLRASYGDPVNVAVPRLTYKPEEYPGLTAR